MHEAISIDTTSCSWAGRGSGHRVPFPNQEANAIDTCWPRENLFSALEFQPHSWVYRTRTRSSWPAQYGFHGIFMDLFLNLLYFDFFCLISLCFDLCLWAFVFLVDVIVSCLIDCFKREKLKREKLGG